MAETINLPASLQAKLHLRDPIPFYFQAEFITHGLPSVKFFKCTVYIYTSLSINCYFKEVPEVAVMSRTPTVT